MRKDMSGWGKLEGWWASFQMPSLLDLKGLFPGQQFYMLVVGHQGRSANIPGSPSTV
jgi:hypothetical protein